MSAQLQVTGEVKIRDIQGPVVANDGVITALDGLPSQYVRGDGTLADIPTVTGGGSSVSYYLNGSVNQGTFGGSTYYQMSRDAITGTGTNFSTSSDGLLAQFITDAGDPDVSSIPSGNWNIEFFMNVSASSGSLASFYVEFYKYDGSTFTLIASNSATPEQLTNTTTVDAYYTSVAFAETALATTDRLAIRIYANVASKTVTLYTEDNRLCQIVTTFSKGLLSMNSLTDQEQYLTTGTSGTNFAIVSSGDTHTFNLPIASATNTGKLSSTDWSTFNNKVPYTGATGNVDLGTYELSSKYLNANGASGLGGVLNIKQDATYLTKGNGYSSIASTSVLFDFFGYTGVSTYKNFALRFDGLTDNTQRTYTLPNASGTLALTSDLSDYVPYTGATSSVDLGAYTLTGAGIFSNPSGTTSGQINLKIGSSNASYVGYNSITALSNGVFAFISDISSGSALKDARFDFGSLTNNTTRTYTFPDLSGTLALLEGAQTFSGAKTFSASVVNDDGLKIKFGSASNLTANYLTLSAYGLLSPNRTVLRLGTTASTLSELIFSQLSSYQYTFPTTSGTLALTSDLSGYVTLATTQTISGLKTFTALATNNEAVGIKLTNGVVSTGGYLTLNSKVVGTLHSLILAPDSTTNRAEFTFDNTALRTYALPDASGTVALTSNLSSYLPLSGGTLTGALSGTSATFSALVKTKGLASYDGIIEADNSSTTGGGIFRIRQNGVISGFISVRGSVLGTTDRNMAYSAESGLGHYFYVNDGSLALTLSSTGAATFSSSVTANSMKIEANAAPAYLYFNNTAAPASNYIALGGSANDLYFKLNGGDRMIITSTGNVGIGTSSPTNFSGYTTLTVNGTSGGVLNTQYNGTDGLRIGSGTNSFITEPRNTFLGIEVNGSERMRITSGGNVGIGFSSPTYKLQVSGNTYLFGASSGSGDYALVVQNSSSTNNFLVRNDGAIALSTFTYGNTVSGSPRTTYIESGGFLGGISSVKASKKNIENVSNVDWLYELNPVTFNYRKKDEEGNYLEDIYEDLNYGLIAEDTAPIADFLVNYNDKEDGTKEMIGIEYMRLITPMLKAIQEQQAQIEELKAKIK